MEYKDNIITVPAGKLPFNQGLGEVLYKEMLLAPLEAVFQVDDTTGQIDTYRDVLKRCIRTAKALQAHNIQPQDVIVLHSHNHINTVVPVIASYFIGAIPSCIDFTLTLEDTVEFLRQIQPRIIFTHSLGVPKLKEAVRQLERDIEIVDFEYFNEFIFDFTPDNFQPIIIKDLDNPAGMFFTSGTSGFPKKLYLSHKLILSTSIHFRGLSNISKVVIICPDSFWISYTETLLFIILHRGTRVLIPRLAAGNICALIKKHEVSILLLAPSLVLQFLNNPPSSNSSLALLFVCGAQCSYHVMRQLRKILPSTAVLPLYGQTEFSGVTLGWSFSKLDDLKLAYERPTSCGRPCLGFSYKIVHPKTGDILGAGKIGEIYFKSVFQPSKLTNGYEWDESGFFKTGDLGYYDDAFCFYITDRIKEVFYYKMISIFPSKLEAILKNHPAVKDAVIIGIPNDFDTNHPMALVVRHETQKDVNENDMIEFFNSKVEDGEQLRGGLKFIDRIPLTATGKTNRAQVKRLVLLNQI